MKIAIPTSDLVVRFLFVSVFESDSENQNVDPRTKNGQTNGRNYTNFESHLAMMVIYLPVKFEFDWTKCFRVRVQKWKC